MLQVPGNPNDYIITATAIAAGGNHTVVLKVAWVTGDNQYGQLSLGKPQANASALTQTARIIKQ